MAKKRDWSSKLLSDPEVVYGKKAKQSESINISSLNEQEESNYRYWLSLTPEQRWAEHFKLLLRVYGKRDNKETGNRIIIDI